MASNGDPKRFNQARSQKYLFSGLAKCAECGGGYVMYWRDRRSPASMARDEHSGAFYITELVNGRVVKVP